jgi:hypothetical protein
MAGRALEIDPKKSVTSDPDFKQTRSDSVNETAIAACAHNLWRRRGCPIGSDQEDWFRAEQELKRSSALEP